MIHFQPIRTRRLAVRLKELSIGDAIKLCSMAPERHEATASEFLSAVIAEAKRTSDRHVIDPRGWTVQERMWVIASYLCLVSDGDFDFAVSENSKLSDFMLAGVDYPAATPLDLGEVAGKRWSMMPLLGAEAEAIEYLQIERKRPGQYHWITGAMAAQLSEAGKSAPSALADPAAYLDYLRARLAAIDALSESDFADMLRVFWDGQATLGHFFSIHFDNAGVVALPRKGAGDDVRPARFPASACISDIAKRLCGKAGGAGG